MPNALVSSLKWVAFSLLNRLADARSGLPNEPRIHPPVTVPHPKRPLIWLFCSTIGEVNACLPLLRTLETKGRLVLLTDRNCYQEVFHRHFPSAHVVELSGRITDAQRLMEELPPSLFIVCEIPAMPADAPCRLSYGLLREAKKSGIPVHLVNGWLYGYAPSCRMDGLEVRLFRKEYLQSFTALGVQNEEIKSRLIEAGAREELISITGNMKFDAIGDADTKLSDPESVKILNSFTRSEDLVVVAGCLADIEESYSLFDAIRKIREKAQRTRFVVAPRHPENPAFMRDFTQGLDERDLPYQFKSQLTGDRVDKNAILILDTFGELKAFYSAASACYVGCNHNVLEPLSFGKVTIVSGEWNSLYPSYPVYQLALEKKLILHAEGAGGIRDAVLNSMFSETPSEESARRILDQLHSLSGAVERTLNTINLPDYPLGQAPFVQTRKTNSKR